MDPKSIFFVSWATLYRTFIGVVLSYITMIMLLRLSGKRTFSKMTAFDLIVPLTLGPIMAATILIPDVPLLQGLFAFGLLIGMHTISNVLYLRIPTLKHVVKPPPTLLVHEGEVLWHAMRKERVSIEEIIEVLRNEGLSSIKQARAVVLESDGDYNVIPREYRDLRSEDVDSFEDCRLIPESNA
jgi:uncharacterized membrane protein YcaP (DUF421 family)